ncbi:hypothetical protein PSCLAVI8L_180058 [Pseudoclavibacter sp. 8L]|nr:hypothetical protein PSCLAVI8L_180058 [Pseudoclavibacter sp. 8L]
MPDRPLSSPERHRVTTLPQAAIVPRTLAPTLRQPHFFQGAVTASPNPLRRTEMSRSAAIIQRGTVCGRIRAWSKSSWIAVPRRCTGSRQWESSWSRRSSRELVSPDPSRRTLE